MLSHIAWDRWSAHRLSKLLGGNLGAHQAHSGSWWPNEDDTGPLTGFDKVGILGEKAITRVNGFCTTLLGYIKDGINTQVALCSWGWPDEIGFVSFTYMPCMTISFRIDSNGTDAHLTARRHDTNSDLASIGDENLSEHALYTMILLGIL